ncbi:hypothetical protein BU24DRAFT_406863 [Aaosphaeria arxii CBS 175.79]|uniref:Uncharacterized protein n=1 Tax=Aaosphaeria arxii CBS 175.79 TaxID=1450172 RepID=A0A6A5Y468_9PLEO|nr:uncharacterized protein BU24DRAFT_406863 [Aaosphaeria arxii CBS 175.79]KAF2020288.1 hypothetical protein BU24DRAFT_406863 [Aaosphaeria arxii CBS 175.79]
MLQSERKRPGPGTQENQSQRTCAKTDHGWIERLRIFQHWYQLPVGDGVVCALVVTRHGRPTVNEKSRFLDTGASQAITVAGTNILVLALWWWSAGAAADLRTRVVGPETGYYGGWRADRRGLGKMGKRRRQSGERRGKHGFTLMDTEDALAAAVGGVTARSAGRSASIPLSWKRISMAGCSKHRGPVKEALAYYHFRFLFDQ